MAVAAAVTAIAALGLLGHSAHDLDRDQGLEPVIRVPLRLPAILSRMQPVAGVDLHEATGLRVGVLIAPALRADVMGTGASHTALLAAAHTTVELLAGLGNLPAGSVLGSLNLLDTRDMAGLGADLDVAELGGSSSSAGSCLSCTLGLGLQGVGGGLLLAEQVIPAHARHETTLPGDKCRRHQRMKLAVAGAELGIVGGSQVRLLVDDGPLATAAVASPGLTVLVERTDGRAAAARLLGRVGGIDSREEAPGILGEDRHLESGLLES